MVKALRLCCLSSCSYIKPQLVRLIHHPRAVVYHLVPTSNHNGQGCLCILGLLFIILFLHQTTTGRDSGRRGGWLFIILFLHQTTTTRADFHAAIWLFIILFLHQTTTLGVCCKPTLGCLSSCSYIKPQRGTKFHIMFERCLSSCSYIKPQPIATNLLVISKILRFWLLRNGRAGRFLLQIY